MGMSLDNRRLLVPGASGTCPPGSVMGTALARERTSLVTGGVLVVLALAAWVGVALQVGMPMPALGATDAAAFLGAWGVMMAAMMLPSATPMIALYGALRRNVARDGPAGISTALFALVYLAAWVAFGVPVYVASVVIGAQTGLADLLPYAVAIVLLAAGVYQLTPLKRACLRVCRNPISFLLARSRTGYRGTLGLPLEHAGYCLGCCWGLMVVLVAAGALALNWVLLIAAVVFVEKLLPRGEWTARIVGGALVLLGLAVAVHPELAMALHPTAMGM
jgi:predicted metal-binding membrane protein